MQINLWLSYTDNKRMQRSIKIQVVLINRRIAAQEQINGVQARKLANIIRVILIDRSLGIQCQMKQRLPSL